MYYALVTYPGTQVLYQLNGPLFAAEMQFFG